MPHRRRSLSQRQDRQPADAEDCAVVARRGHDILQAIVADLGGEDRLSEVRLQLARRFAAGAALAEEMETRRVRGDQIDIAAHAFLCSTLARLAQMIGTDLRTRDRTPTVSDFLRADKVERPK